MRAYICDECAIIPTDRAAIGDIVKDAEALHKEGLHVNRLMLTQALTKYNEAAKALKAAGGHADCVKYLDNEYMLLFRFVAGSRA